MDLTDLYAYGLTFLCSVTVGAGLAFVTVRLLMVALGWPRLSEPDDPPSSVPQDRLEGP